MFYSAKRKKFYLSKGDHLSVNGLNDHNKLGLSGQNPSLMTLSNDQGDHKHWQAKH